MRETFKPMLGRPGYFVSDQGRVLSLKRRKPAILSVRKNRAGLAEAEVFHRSKTSFINVGREVLAAFRGYPSDPWLCVAHHLNGDLMDCRLENLEWVICETDSTYDPTKSKRRGVKKAEHTRDRMTEAKFNQSAETILKAIESRKNAVELRRIFKDLKSKDRDSGDEQDNIRDIYIVMNRIDGK